MDQFALNCGLTRLPWTGPEMLHAESTRKVVSNHDYFTLHTAMLLYFRVTVSEHAKVTVNDRFNADINQADVESLIESFNNIINFLRFLSALCRGEILIYEQHLSLFLKG